MLASNPLQATIAVVKSGQRHRNSYRICCSCRQKGAELAKGAQMVKTTSYSVAEVILHGDSCINNQASISNSGREWGFEFPSHTASTKTFSRWALDPHKMTSVFSSLISLSIPRVDYLAFQAKDLAGIMELRLPRQQGVNVVSA